MTPVLVGEPVDLPLRGELRYGCELARLVLDPASLRPGRHVDAPPVLPVPGFMAGDASLAALRGWLRRRGSRAASAGMRLNLDCAERTVGRLEGLAPELHAVAIYSRSDGIVSWRACLDPEARHVEVESSHAGMSVDRAVYQVLTEILEEETAWSS